MNGKTNNFKQSLASLNRSSQAKNPDFKASQVSFNGFVSGAFKQTSPVPKPSGLLKTEMRFDYQSGNKAKNVILLEQNVEREPDANIFSQRILSNTKKNVQLIVKKTSLYTQNISLEFKQKKQYIQIQIKIMLQRHHRNNVDQLVAFAKQELQRDLPTLKDNSSRIMHLSATADTILGMYENLSYPFIGFQVIKQNLTITKHPHALQIEMILDKAQLFYLESVKHDLNKLKEDEKIQNLNSEDIKQYIQEINWKLGLERESILNQSQQEIGDNIDLMKFFEGVRNFQNWEENLEKQTIQKLKNFANRAESQINLRKGFLISKIDKIYETEVKSRQKQLINRLKVNSNKINKLSVFSKIDARKVKQTFFLLSILASSKNSTTKLQQLFKRGADRINSFSLVALFRKIKKTHLKTEKLLSTINRLSQKKLLVHKIRFMKFISSKAYQKCEKIGRALEKLKNFSKKYAAKNMIKDFFIHSFKLSKLLNKLYLKKASQTMKNIQNYVIHRQMLKEAVSQKVRGRILVSISRHGAKPINIKKTFLNWYLKSHEEKYSKMVYNIWLNGNISKFTFLMRLKNVINDSRKQKISQELKVFLLIFIQKMNGYYNYTYKGFMNRWLERHRYCKKLHHLLNVKDKAVRRLDNDLLRKSLMEIVVEGRKKKLLESYLRKRIKKVQADFLDGFKTWKNLPNLKKVIGRAQLINFLRVKLNEIESEQRKIFDNFRDCKIKGRQKKIRFVAKVFTKDLLYLSYFLNHWRRGRENEKNIFQRKEEVSQISKKNSTQRSFHTLSWREHSNKRQAFLKIKIRANYLFRRKQLCRKTFSNMISSNSAKNIKQSLGIFKQNNVEGRVKKDKLVRDLVTANKMKQAESLHIWNSGAKVDKQGQKKKRVGDIVAGLNTFIKKTLDAVIRERYMFLYLQKVQNNYQSNVANSLLYIKKLPRRINWEKKGRVLKFFNNLQQLTRSRKVEVLQKHKVARYEGDFRKKKILNYMYYKYVDCSVKYFKTYLGNVREIKMQEKHNIVFKIFEDCNSIEKSNFQPLLTGQKLWIKKADHFNRLNKRLTERIKQSFKLWYNTTKSLTYFLLIRNQKKKRVLDIISQLLFKNAFSETKKNVNLFYKNYKIKSLQINFLKRLCDSQAGKVIKSFMIWKNLPKPTNKQLVARASKFERNLFNFSQKVMKISLEKFKDQQYQGNEKKKQAVRNLVAKSCTGIDKYFSIWKKNNKLTTLFSQCHMVESVFSSWQNIEVQNFLVLMEGNRSIRLEHSLDKIQDWWKKQCSRIMKKWREGVEEMKNRQKIKKMSIMQMGRIQSEVQKRKMLAILIKFKKQLFLRNLFERSFVHNKKMRVHLAIETIKGLPDRLLIKKIINKKKAALQLFQKLETEVRGDTIKIFDCFRDERYQGNFKKMRSCGGYLKDKISQIHRILALWVNMKRADKQRKKQERVLSVFQQSWGVTRANFSQILESATLTKKKKNCLEKLFNAMEIKKKGFFNLWRQTTKQMSFNEKINNEKKKAILEKINKLIAGTSSQTLKKAIKNFQFNFKIKQIQIKFIQRLLQTKSGKVLEAFNTWKKIPQQNIMEKYKKGQKFYFKLQAMLKNKLGQVHTNFKKYSEEGNTAKKQSVLQLLQMTSSGIRKFYNRWIRITKRDHTLKQAYTVMHSLDSLHHSVTDMFKILFEDQRTIKIKTWAIEKIISTSNQNIGLYLKKWKQNAHQKKLFQENCKKEKTTALQMFANVLGGAEALQIRQIILKFNKNAAISRISRNFLNRLLKTKSGKVVQLFQIWKSIPDAKVAKKKKKAIKFESSLHRISSRYLKAVFEPFKMSSHEARNKKKACIQRLIRASMGEEKKKLLLWREIIREEKILNHTHLFDSIFQALQQKTQQNISLLIKDTKKQMVKKKSLCRNLANNSLFIQHHSYLIWKQALQVDNVKIERTEARVKSNLVNLITTFDKVQNRRLIQILSYFKKKQQFRLRLESQIKKEEKNRKCISLYDKLSGFANQNLKVFLSEVFRNHQEKILIDKSKQLSKTFEALTDNIANSLQIAFESNRETVVKQKIIFRLFANINSSIEKAFHLWREHKNILRQQAFIKDQSKRSVLLILKKAVQGQQNTRISQIIDKFKKNCRSLKVRKDILGKILQCKAGKVPLAFMIWKSLPNPNAKKMKQRGMKFESNLARLVHRNLRETYSKFKDQTNEGTNKKRNAARRLVLVSLSDSNRCFNKWRKVSSESKITDKILSITKIFESSNCLVKENISIFDNFRLEQKKKKIAIERIIENTKINLANILKQWRGTLKDEKCYFLQKVLDQYDPIRFNANLIRRAFDKIKQKSQTQTLRTYINSLWKWKASNLEANYYSKFIKIFKESEQLLTLSTTFNRILNEHLHFGFRKIICQGADRHNRKKRITEKYMLRKVNNYFQRFKLNASQEEIKIWRNMYKSTIKGKKLFDLVDLFVRRKLYDSLQKIIDQNRIRNSAEAFEVKMLNFNRLVIQDAWDRILQSGMKKCCSTLDNILNKISFRVKSQVFQTMLTTSQTNKLVLSMERIFEKLVKKQGFAKVYQKSVLKVKCRLAINLLTCLERQKEKEKIYRIIEALKKNYHKIQVWRNILVLLASKKTENMRHFYRILQQGLEKKILLTRFKKGMAIKKILENQDQKALKRIFDRLKKKENKWIGDSARKFVLRSNIKSSMAVSLWRLKSFAQKAAS